MVLDHVRDFFTSPSFSPTDPDRASVILFFTRFVTHYCAPIFVLLAGAGVGLSRARGRSRVELAGFLVSRGAWLVFLELTWVRFGWQFNLDYHSTGAQVTWALGWCMVLLAALLILPTFVIALVGAVVVVGHNAFDHVSSQTWIWRVLHNPGPIAFDEAHQLRIAYPLVPWVGVMALGYVLGLSWMQIQVRHLVRSGVLFIVVFFFLRMSNVYGDPHPFVGRGARSIFAALDVQKYPPSLDYLLITLGPALLVLAWLRSKRFQSEVLSTFGRVPLFFYLLHLPLVHALSLPFRAYHHLALVSGPFKHGLDEPLWVVYAITMLTVAILWAPCRRWAALKSARTDWWLSYL